MKIITGQQTRELDRFTMENEPIRSIDLMERAAAAFVDRLTYIYLSQKSFYILCGKGNNGGDGLAIARLLDGLGLVARVVILEHSDACSKDHVQNLKRLKDLRSVDIAFISKSDQIPLPKEEDLIIDAILGSGMDRPLVGLIKECVEIVNEWPNELVSVDIPTGLFSEFNLSNENDSIIQSSNCITFHAPKLSFLLADNSRFVKQFQVVDIGLNSVGEISSKWHYLKRSEISELLKPEGRFSHKGTFGHAMIIAGSFGKIGASILSGQGALRSGCGLVTVRTPLCGLNPLQSSFPEAMCLPDGCETHLAETVRTEGFSAIGIGPGIGFHEDTHNVLKMLIQNTTSPMVLDADALNILAENQTWLQFLPPNTILTPHPGEFDRLVGKCQSSEERLTKQIEFAEKINCILVLKGAHTSIACPDGQVIFNSTGNAGMATSGSGDVLTGILTGFLAQGYHPKHAAIIGVYLHGLAGELAEKEQGRSGLIASDIIRNLGPAAQQVKVPKP